MRVNLGIALAMARSWEQAVAELEAAVGAANAGASRERAQAVLAGIVRARDLKAERP